jgi:hypothetical protein
MSTATNSSSSSTRAQALDHTQEANTELPVVDGLHEPFETPHITTAADKGQAAIQRHAATIRKLKEQEREIADQHEKLQFMIDSLESRRQEYMALESSQPIETRRTDSPSARNIPTETPCPHRHIPKAERPADIAYYRQQQAEQQQAEQQQAEAQQNQAPATPEQQLMHVFQSLTKVISDNNKHLHSSDVTEPA